jgi:diaminopimelate epimerase
LISLTFTKATGAGNDFVIIDEFEVPLEVDPGPVARALCDRHFGIGADGLLLIRPHAGAAFEMRYFNADGSSGGMCGNGGRCAAHYAHERGIAAGSLRFQALDYVYHAEVAGQRVRLSMKDPKIVRADLVLHSGDASYQGHLFDTGAPHLVVFSEHLDALDVFTVGRALRHHPDLAPQGANINFVAVGSDGVMTLRTYERGVEDETLACGTGSVASATAGVLYGGLESPVTVRVRSREELTVQLHRERDRVSAVVLEGPARLLYTGSCQYDPATGTIVTNPGSR